MHVRSLKELVACITMECSYESSNNTDSCISHTHSIFRYCIKINVEISVKAFV